MPAIPAPVRLVLLLAILLAGLFPAEALGQGRPSRRGGGGGEEVKVRAVPLWNQVYANDQFPLAVVIEHQPNWHSWPAKTTPDVLPPEIAEFAIRTEIRLADDVPPAWLRRVGPTQYPVPKLGLVADPSGGPPVEVPLYSDQAVAFIPLTIAPDAPPGPQTLRVIVAYQACDDKVCLMPQRLTLEVPLTILPGTPADGTTRGSTEPALFATFNPAAFAADATPASSAVDFNVFGWRFSIDPAGAGGLAALLGLAALGGLLLNFTPCVLPVIPIKILGLSQSAGSPGRCLLLGAIMSAGVIAFWGGIGLAIAFISGFKAISTLFQTPWFSIGVGVFMLAMGAGMLGAFLINLPNWVYTIDPSRESAKGSFGFGIMTAVLSTPCTAPFMGAAAAWAATQKPPVTLATFASIGVGMAVPYLLLAANPKWLKLLPRSGPGSELLKQVMGLLILAVAAFFLGLGLSALLAEPPQPASLVYWWVVGAIVAIACVWAFVQTLKLTRSPIRRGAVGLAALGVMLASGMLVTQLTDRGPVRWVYYTPEKFEQARREGKVVVLDFTADWCLNCKAMEAAVLFQPEVAQRLNSDGVVPMKVDLTADNPPGREKLKSLDWVGIPLLAVFGPGLAEPLKFDAYTVPMVREALEQAARPAQTPPTTPPGSGPAPSTPPGG
jgi:thiol:disulfide interchange protein